MLDVSSLTKDGIAEKECSGCECHTNGTTNDDFIHRLLSDEILLFHVAPVRLLRWKMNNKMGGLICKL